jgi:hypothetical protein
MGLLLLFRDLLPKTMVPPCGNINKRKYCRQKRRRIQCPYYTIFTEKVRHMASNARESLKNPCCQLLPFTALFIKNHPSFTFFGPSHQWQKKLAVALWDRNASFLTGFCSRCRSPLASRTEAIFSLVKLK